MSKAFGGGGKVFDWSLVPAGVPHPLVLSGGLHAGNVVAGIQQLRPWAVDVSSGVESARGVKDAAAIRRFCDAVREADARDRRLDLPESTIPCSTISSPTARGHFGRYGGSFVAETLVHALDELKACYDEAQRDPAFDAEFRSELAHYVGRPSPIYHAARLSRELGGAQIYLKREDLNHTGAHKINNTIGQALLARRMGKPRVIAETGAGQHGVATATICARYGLECVVYMGSEDVKRQAPNVYRMNLLGATRGAGRERLEDAQGRDQRGDARLGDERREHVLHHRHRRRPASVPDDGARLPARDRRRVPGADARDDRPPARCGDRLRRRRQQRDGHLLSRTSATNEHAPDRRRGGRRGHRDRPPRRVDLRPAARACCTATAPTCCRTRTARSSRRTRSRPASTIPASAPSTPTCTTSAAPNTSRVTDDEALAAFHRLCRTEGIIPALESSHAVAYAMKLAPTLRQRPAPARQPLGPRRQGHRAPSPSSTRARGARGERMSRIDGDLRRAAASAAARR